MVSVDDPSTTFTNEQRNSDISFFTATSKQKGENRGEKDVHCLVKEDPPGREEDVYWMDVLSIPFIYDNTLIPENTLFPK